MKCDIEYKWKTTYVNGGVSKLQINGITIGVVKEDEYMEDDEVLLKYWYWTIGTMKDTKYYATITDGQLALLQTLQIDRSDRHPKPIMEERDKRHEDYLVLDRTDVRCMCRQADQPLKKRPWLALPKKHNHKYDIIMCLYCGAVWTMRGKKVQLLKTENIYRDEDIGLCLRNSLTDRDNYIRTAKLVNWKDERYILVDHDWGAEQSFDFVGGDLDGGG